MMLSHHHINQQKKAENSKYIPPQGDSLPVHYWAAKHLCSVMLGSLMQIVTKACAGHQVTLMQHPDSLPMLN